MNTVQQGNPETIGLESEHGYSVIGYEPGNNGGQVTLRNPWGEYEKSGSDIIHLTMDQLFSVPVVVNAEMDGSGT